MTTKKLPTTQEEKLLKAIFGPSPRPRSTKTTRCMAKVVQLAKVEGMLDTAQRHVHKGRLGEARGMLIKASSEWYPTTPKIQSSVKSALKMVSPKKGISRYKMEQAILDARLDVNQETSKTYRKCRR